VLGVLLCDKVLVYSDHCRGVDTGLAVTQQWVTISATLATDGLGGDALSGLLRRPVELSLFGSMGQVVEVRNIELTDDAGRPALTNGDFSQGLDRWVFTDDSHVSWRMLNQYLMLFFETGSLGMATFVALAGLACAGGGRALRSGATDGSTVAGAIAGFMVCGLFDNVLEAPRLATLFFLICWCGLLQWQTGSTRPDQEGSG
jgi:hypothetical protein